MPRPDVPRAAAARPRPLLRQPYQVTAEVGRETPEAAFSRRLARHANHPTAGASLSGGSAAPGGRLVRDAYQEPAVGPARRRHTAPRTLIVGCGALARELVALTADLPAVDVACLPPELHNHPGRIPAAVRDRIRRGRAQGYDRVFVAYADCGTGGLLDPVLAEEGVERLAGAHCYEFFAGKTDFARLADEEPGTFWLTDFLARNFERLVIRGLGIDRHPELKQQYFGNYRRVVYLSQTDDPDLVAMARRAAERLGLAFEHRHTGYGELATSIQSLGVTDSGSVVHPVSATDGFDAESAVDDQPVNSDVIADHRASADVNGTRLANRTSASPNRHVARVHPVQTEPVTGGAAG